MRKELVIAALKNTTSKIAGSIWNHLNVLGVQDDDINVLLPSIRDKIDELTAVSTQNKDIISAVKDFIDTEMGRLNLTLLQDPQQVIHKIENGKSSIDALARLLARDLNAITPCVAVTIHNNKLIISFNSSIDTDTTDDKIKQLLLKKMTEVRFFLNNALRLEGKVKAIAELVAKTTTNKNVAADLISLLNSVGEVDKKSILSGENRAVILGDVTPKIILPTKYDDERNANGKYHAEQLLALYLFVNTEDDIKNQQYYIGISKLCCFACEKVLTQLGIEHLGTHGVTFPGVVDIVTGMKAVYPVTTKLLTKNDVPESKEIASLRSGNAPYNIHTISSVLGFFAIKAASPASDNTDVEEMKAIHCVHA